MTAIGTENLVARTATTFTFSGQISNGSTPIDLTTYSAVFTARAFAGSPTVWVTVSTPQIALTSQGFVTFTIPNEVMATVKPNKGVYDLVIRNASGQDEFVLEGRFIVTPAVTLNV
jgi:hypothetical protein